jgi:hypothetical protein
MEKVIERKELIMEWIVAGKIFAALFGGLAVFAIACDLIEAIYFLRKDKK